MIRSWTIGKQHTQTEPKLENRTIANIKRNNIWKHIFQMTFQCKCSRACFKPEIIKINQREFTIIWFVTWNENTLFFHSEGLGEASVNTNLQPRNLYSKLLYSNVGHSLQLCGALLEGNSWISYSWQAGSTRRTVCAIDLKLPVGGWKLIKLEL